MFKKSIIMFLTLVLLLSLSLTAAAAEYNWKMGSVYKDPVSVKNFNPFGFAVEMFCDLVNQRSDGRLEIKPYYSGVLGGNQEMFQQVRRGELEVYMGQPMSSIDKRFGIWNVPYLFKSIEEAERLACDPHGPIFKMSKEWLAEHDVVLLAVGSSIIRDIANNKRMIKTPEDLSDLTIRTYQDPIAKKFWDHMATAQPMSFGEVYTALQTGAVGGLEFSPTGVLNTNMYEVTEYYTDIGWQWNNGAPLMVGEKHWNELPDDLKYIVQKAADEAMQYQGIAWRRDARHAMAALKEKGIKVHHLTDEERQLFIDKAKELYPEFKKMIGEETFDEVIRVIEEARAK